MSPLEYCQDKAARPGSTLHYALLFTPAKQRQAHIALWAFCAEIDRISEDAVERSVAREKFDWWRGEIRNTFAGSPRHPVSKALHPGLEEFGIPERRLQDLVDGVAMGLDIDAYVSFTQLAAHCERTGSNAALVMAKIGGFEDEGTERFACDLGIALRLTKILRDLCTDVSNRRFYIPAADMAGLHISPHAFLENEVSEKLRDLLALEVRRAQDYYQNALDQLPESDRYRQLAGVTLLALNCALLEEMDKDGCRLLEHRVELTPLRKLWIAWRTARQEKARHKKHHGSLAPSS